MPKRWTWTSAKALGLAGALALIILALLVLPGFLSAVLTPERRIDIRIVQVIFTESEGCAPGPHFIRVEIHFLNLGDGTGFAKVQIFAEGKWVADLVYIVYRGESTKLRAFDYSGDCNPVLSYVLADTWTL